MHARALLSLYFVALLWSLTAPLGKYITLPALPLIFWRILLCSILIIPFTGKNIRQLYRHNKPLFKTIIYSGILISLHWLTFYESIKLGNISIATICLASSSFFIYWVDFFWKRSSVNYAHIIQSVLLVLSFILIVQGSEKIPKIGVFMGLLSAIINAFYLILNAQIMRHTDKTATVLSVQLIVSTYTLLILSFLAQLLALRLALPHLKEFALQMPRQWQDIIALLIFAVLCTLLPFYLYLRSSPHIPPFTLSIILNLEPILSIIIGIVFFHDYQDLSLKFYIGGILVLALISVASKNAVSKKEGV